MFGFSLNTEAMWVLNYCILYVEYYIFVQRILKNSENNELNLHDCLTQLQHWI